MPKINPYDRTHLSHLTSYERKILQLYNEAVRKVALAASSIQGFNSEDIFSFNNYPILRSQVNKLLSGLNQNVQAAIVNGIEAEWTLANNKNSELARQVFGDNIGKLSQAQYRRYFSNNDTALQAFLSRKEGGLDLSQRVWKYTGAFKSELEMGLDLGIRNGLSAAEMTKDLRDYLQHPDKLFRRVRDEHGNLHLSKSAADFHPGQGVYRSSYMNARRLAATETNIAYHTADYERWQQMDFVVGIEIVLSNNHNCKGVPEGTYFDICDELAGQYPKDFKFTGWHPHCRCHAITILKTWEEQMADSRRLMNGEEIDGQSVNRVEDVPDKFKEWVIENMERSQRSYSVPYFLKDNPKYVPEGVVNLYASKMPYPTFAEYEQAMKYNKAHANFSKEQLANIRELNNVLPVMQGQIMHFGLADNSHPNPYFSIENASLLGYHHNCQTCTVAYELRRRGFDIEAMQNTVVRTTAAGRKVRSVEVFFDDKGFDWTERFLNPDGSKIVPFKSSGIANSIEAKRNFIHGHTAAQGRYEIYCQWDSSNAHVFIVERQANGKLLWYDPQSGLRGKEIEDYLKKMLHNNIWVTRIDDKIINPKFAPRLRKPKQ